MCKLGAAFHSRHKNLIISLVGLMRKGKGRCFGKICKFSWCSLITVLTSAQIIMINLEPKPFWAGVMTGIICTLSCSVFQKWVSHVCSEIKFCPWQLPEIFMSLFLTAYLSFWLLQGILSSGLDAEVIC